MEIKKFIFAITGLLFFMSVPATPGRIHLTPDEPIERTGSIHTFELNRKPIVVAENEPQAAENESRSTNENKDQSPDSETAERQKSDNNSNAAATKPIKPFRPSEEIAAEQAVDYPVDI